MEQLFQEYNAEPKSFYQEITPGLAEQYLKKNVGNRTLRPKLVNEYAWDMTRDVWKISHQGIAFDKEGNLIDGQHRLQAIIKSGKTIKSQVTVGLNKESVKSIDTGRSRTYDEAMTILGSKLPPKFTTTLRSMFLAQTLGQHIFSHEELDFLRHKHEKAVMFALDCFNKPMESQIKNGTVMGVVARSFYSSPLPRVQQFVDVLSSGIGNDSKDNGAIKLRTFRFTNPIGGGSSKAELYKKTENALWAFINDKPIDKLYGSDSELFPIPE